MTTEDVRTVVRNTLEDLLGVDGAAFLMDRPPGGWSDLATHRDIDALEARMNAQFAAVDRRFTALEASFDSKLTALEASFDSKLGSLETSFNTKVGSLEASFDTKLGSLEDRLRGAMSDEFKAQTWRLIGAMAGLLAILVGAIKL